MKMISKMKIVINALSALRGGGQTYLINLLDEFILLNFDCELIIITNKMNTHIFDKYKSNNITILESSFASKNIIFRVLWECMYLPFLLKFKKINSYFSPGGIMVTLTPKACKSYTALRNMLPFDERERSRFPLFSYVRFKLWLLKHVFLLSYKMADKVIFISQYSLTEVCKYLPEIEKKAQIIYHGINEDFLKTQDSTEYLEFNLVRKEYYLYVSILDVYKAQKEVVESWVEMNSNGNEIPLVLVGPKYNNYGEEVVDLIASSKADNINYIGAVDYNNLPSLYQNARGLIFASSCECCPNILLEKLASGRPVISSDIMPMPEFGQDSVVYFNPYEDGSLEKAVNYLEKENNLDKYSKLSSIRAKSFSWKKTTSNTFKFLLNQKID
jgi:glycosyltransferase involved in cell wall biosynthesis